MDPSKKVAAAAVGGGGVEVAEPEQEAREACGGEGGFGGQFH